MLYWHYTSIEAFFSIFSNPEEPRLHASNVLYLTVEGGARLIVQEWAIFAEDEIKHRLQPVTPPQDPLAEEEMDLRSKAEKALARAGLRVYVLDGDTFLAIANTHKMLSQVYRDSKWMMVPGAQSSGWMQALSRVPGVRKHQLRVAGKSTRCKLVPWALVTGDGNDEGFAAEKDVCNDAECDSL